MTILSFATNSAFERPRHAEVEVRDPANHDVPEERGAADLDTADLRDHVARQELEAATEHLQSELRDLAHVSFEILEGRPHGQRPDGFPDDWKPRWQPGTPYGLKRTPWDLDPENPPSWASVLGQEDSG